MQHIFFFSVILYYWYKLLKFVNSAQQKLIGIDWLHLDGEIVGGWMLPKNKAQQFKPGFEPGLLKLSKV